MTSDNVSNYSSRVLRTNSLNEKKLAALIEEYNNKDSQPVEKQSFQKQLSRSSSEDNLIRLTGK